MTSSRAKRSTQHHHALVCSMVGTARACLLLLLAHLLGCPFSPRSKGEWHHRFGDKLGMEAPTSRPASEQWRALKGPMDLSHLPPPGRPSMSVEPTTSALRWDAALSRNNLPMKAPSVASSKHSAVSLPSMRTVSITSSADRRRELLMERHAELQAQLQLVEQMLKQNTPSTMLSALSGVSRASGMSRASQVSHMSQASRVRGESGASGGSAAKQRDIEPMPERRAPRVLLGPIPELRDILPPREPAQYGAVPLCLDKQDPDYKALSPFKSVTGVGLAMPGTALSSAHSPRH